MIKQILKNLKLNKDILNKGFKKAVLDQNFEAINDFLKIDQRLAYISIDSDNNSSLHISVKNNNYKITKYLSTYFIDLNIINKKNETPLHIACKNGYEKIAELLIELKAKIDILDINNESPLDLALKKENKFKKKEYENIIIMLINTIMIEDINI